MLHYYCDCCHKEIKPPEVRFLIKLEMLAAAEPLVFTREEMEKDHRSELEHLVKIMEEHDPQDINDEVYVNYEFDLCSRCRRQFYHQFKRQIPLDFKATSKIKLD
jgi:hypothetical protein